MTWYANSGMTVTFCKLNCYCHLLIQYFEVLHFLVGDVGDVLQQNIITPSGLVDNVLFPEVCNSNFKHLFASLICLWLQAMSILVSEHCKCSYKDSVAAYFKRQLPRVWEQCSNYTESNMYNKDFSLLVGPLIIVYMQISIGAALQPLILTIATFHNLFLLTIVNNIIVTVLMVHHNKWLYSSMLDAAMKSDI